MDSVGGFGRGNTGECYSLREHSPALPLPPSPLLSSPTWVVAVISRLSSSPVSLAFCYCNKDFEATKFTKERFLSSQVQRLLSPREWCGMQWEPSCCLRTLASPSRTKTEQTYWVSLLIRPLMLSCSLRVIAWANTNSIPKKAPSMPISCKSRG